MFRKRRRPTPGFGIPPPYSPIQGQHAPLRDAGDYPYCALMQIAVADTHADYVICRGYDPRIKKYVEYDADDSNKPGIAVAKPWNNRVTGAYTVGHVFPAVIPLTRLGQNPGVAETSQGQPADLDEDVELLKDDNNVYINWMMLDVSAGNLFYNGSGATVPAYAIMAVTGVHEIDDDVYVTKIDKPSTTFYRHYIVNGGSDVEDASVGQYQNMPEVKVLYDTGTPAVGESWGPKSAQWTVSKSYPETCVVIGVIDTTDKVMLAGLHPINKLFAKLDADLNTGSSCTASIWAGATLADVSVNVTAYDWFMEASKKIASGAKVDLTYYAGKWYVTQSDTCPEDQ